MPAPAVEIAVDGPKVNFQNHLKTASGGGSTRSEGAVTIFVE